MQTIRDYPMNDWYTEGDYHFRTGIGHACIFHNGVAYVFNYRNLLGNIESHGTFDTLGDAKAAADARIKQEARLWLDWFATQAEAFRAAIETLPELAAQVDGVAALLDELADFWEEGE